jgi:hypothetical protein
MTEDGFDEMIRDAARLYHDPPPTPREEMWAAIEAERRDARRFTPWYRGWTTWGVGIAAVLMIGIGLGRLSVRPAAPPIAATAATAPDREETAYRLAATQHLGQAEVLLTSFRTGARSGEVDARVGVLAKELLSNTRLLLDSPAGVDPKLRKVLEDLELVLAQLSQLPADESTRGARQEVQMVNDAIEEARVLPKLRTAIGGVAPPALYQERL